MAGVEDSAGIFTIPDFWKLPDLANEPLSTTHNNNPFFSLELSTLHSLAARDDARVFEPSPDSFFQLPDILGHSKLGGSISPLAPEINTPDDGSVDSRSSGSLEDVWLFSDEVPVKPTKYKSWSDFDHPAQEAQLPLFFTEAGPSVFDSFLASDVTLPNTQSQVGRIVAQPAAYCACLLALALGRDSSFFMWQPRHESFSRTYQSLKLSGHSDESLEGIEHLCISCGNSTKFLRAFVDRIFSGPFKFSSCRIALAGALDKLLVAIQSEVSPRGHRAHTVLQMQAIVHPARSILEYFEGLVQKLWHCKTDEHILSTLFEEAQSVEHQSSLLRDAVREVLRIVSKPWTGFVEEWIGVKSENGFMLTKNGPGKGFVRVDTKVWVDDFGIKLEEPDFFLDEGNMPSFVPEEMGRELFETGRNLRFLRSNHPSHVLSQPDLIQAAGPPTLQWSYDWESIMREEEGARAYETSVSQLIGNNGPAERRTLTQVEPHGPARSETDFFGKTAAQIEASILASMDRFNRPPTPPAQDYLTVLVRDGLFRTKSLPDYEDFSPHWSLLPLLSFGPLVSAQARLVNRECTKLLFTSHGLRVHLDLQKQFHLLGNGVFCSQLAHALFDPDLDTAERQAGVALSGGNMGLRLTGRDTWPPASSELSLALTGVLSDSFDPQSQSSQKMDRSSSRTHKPGLPGDISFGVRDLSPEEIERCVDSNSLEALDFLRLSYRPPATLQSIMTSTALVKYDLLFKLLLRLLRMLYVVKQLFRETMWTAPKVVTPNRAELRFRIEANHFVSQIAAYFFDSGIAQPWSHFEAWLDRVEMGLYQETGENGDAPKKQGSTISPDHLRERHEQTLDAIMRNLLLRKRQAPVLKLLEDTFTVILKFTNLIRKNSSSGSDTPESLYATFRKKLEVFLTVCKALGEKRQGVKAERSATDGEETALAQNEGDEGTIERLVLMLDMGGLYVKRSKGEA